MSYAFLHVDAAAPGVVARSPMERAARAAGARFELRDGWNVAVGFRPVEEERELCARAVGWADCSYLGKLEVHGDPAAIELALGTAQRVGETWWCPLTRERALAIGPAEETAALRARLGEAAVDVSNAYAALRIAGPLARELFARFCALDLRPHVAPVAAFRPGSVARTPGMVLCEGADRYLALVGAALGEYLWTVVQDAGLHLGGEPVGVDALAPDPQALARA